jgi:hypothetical protein
MGGAVGRRASMIVSNSRRGKGIEIDENDVLFKMILMDDVSYRFIVIL